MDFRHIKELLDGLRKKSVSLQETGQPFFRDIIQKNLNRKIDSRKRPEDINLGIDLGTSFSKVVWRLREKSRPVCFDARKDDLDSYLVPSIIHFSEGAFKTVSSAHRLTDSESATTIQNFKICLACEAEKNTTCLPGKCRLSEWNVGLFPEKVSEQATSLVTAFFLAKLISQSKRAVVGDLKKMGVKPESIRWSANLAVPERFLERSRISDSFEEMLRVAWLMSFIFDEYPDFSQRDEVIESYRFCLSIAQDKGVEMDCFVYPEVAAEVASVTLSRSSQDGLYAFVDIGAGTVDASVFRLNRPLGEDRQHNTYAAEVFRTGAAQIESLALEILKKKVLPFTKKNGRLRECLKMMKENRWNRRGEFSEAESKILNTALCQALAEVEKQVREDLIKVFGAAYEKERQASRWAELKLVLGGGGAALQTYQEAANYAFTLKHNNSRPTQISLPMPTDFHMNGIDASCFHRFAVAYGLSFPRVNLPEVALATEVRPLKAPSAERTISMVSKDEC